MSSQVSDSDLARRRAPLNQPAPNGFAAQARKRTVQQLRRLYGRSDHVILRWLAETGIDRKPHAPSAPPADLPAKAAAMHFSALCRHYAVSERRLRRWIALTGIEPLPFARPAKAPKAPRGRPRRARCWPPILAALIRRRPPDEPRRDMSPEGRAADHLRRFAPCYRCGADGRAARNGKLWRYGNVVLDGVRLRARARRLGWHENPMEGE